MTTETDIASDAIREAARIAVAAGNSLKALSAEWELKQVAFMDHAISSDTRADILSALPDLEHTITGPTPQNPATEAFIDRSSDVALTFPAHGEQRRWY